MNARNRRLLYLTSEWPWPPTSGGRLQVTHLAALFGERYEVAVLATDRKSGEFHDWDAMVKRVQMRRASQMRRAVDTAQGIVLGRQVLLQRLIRAGAAEALRRTITRYRPSVLVLGRPLFATLLDVAAEAQVPAVIEANEDLERVARSIVASSAPSGARAKAAVDAVVVGRQQRRDYPKAHYIMVCSDVEREYITRYVSPSKVQVVPNMVDIPATTGSSSPISALAFVGSYGYAPNELAAVELMRDILPAVTSAGGPSRAVLIGRDPTPRMRRLAASGKVEITGEVEDVPTALREAGVMVVPLRTGGGTRVKILEAAAAGVPVVSTAFGLEGLVLQPDRHVLQAESPAEFASAVLRLQSDDHLRHRLTSAAETAVREHNSLAAGRSALAGMLEKLDRLSEGE